MKNPALNVKGLYFFQILILVGVSLMGFSLIEKRVFAHEEGAPFSGAIIEPLEVHHAHIENEQKFNFFFLDGAPIEEEEEAGAEEGEEEEVENKKTRRDIFRHTYELAWRYTDDFRWGSEIIIPFSNEGENDGHRVYGVGDIEIQPLKYAFINRPETILTGMLAITPPTGSRSRGFSEGKTGIAPHLFLDKAYRNWFLGLNQAIEIEVGNDHEVHYEYSEVVAYSFIRETKDGPAAVEPDQWLVPSVSMEFLGETRVGGKDAGKTEFAILPGINLWNPKSGWSVRLGMKFPLTEERESNKTIFIQIGNHLNWTRWRKSGQ